MSPFQLERPPDRRSSQICPGRYGPRHVEFQKEIPGSGRSDLNGLRESQGYLNPAIPYKDSRSNSQRKRSNQLGKTTFSYVLKDNLIYEFNI